MTKLRETITDCSGLDGLAVRSGKWIVRPVLAVRFGVSFAVVAILAFSAVRWNVVSSIRRAVGGILQCPYFVRRRHRAMVETNDGWLFCVFVIVGCGRGAWSVSSVEVWSSKWRTVGFPT